MMWVAWMTRCGSCGLVCGRVGGQPTVYVCELSSKIRQLVCSKGIKHKKYCHAHTLPLPLPWSPLCCHYHVIKSFFLCPTNDGWTIATGRERSKDIRLFHDPHTATPPGFIPDSWPGPVMTPSEQSPQNITLIITHRIREHSVAIFYAGFCLTNWKCCFARELALLSFHICRFLIWLIGS